MGACSPKPARGQHRDLGLLSTIASCCQRSEAGQSSSQGRWLLLDARLSEPASHPYLVLSVVWTPPQAFLQPPCHMQSRLCLDFRGQAFVVFIFLSLGVSHLLCVDSCLLYPLCPPSLNWLFPGCRCSGSPCSSPSFHPVLMDIFLARCSIA